MRRIDKKRNSIKLLKITKKRSLKWLIIMKMPIMLLKRTRMPLKQICKTFSTNLKRKIKLCNSKLRIKIDILLSLKITTITYKSKQTGRMINNLRNLPEKEKNLLRKLNNSLLKFQREKEPLYLLKIRKKECWIRSKTNKKLLRNRKVML